MSAYSGFSDALAARQAQNLFDAGAAEDPSRVAWGYGNAIASDLGGDGAAAVSDRWSVWAQGFGRWSTIGNDGGLPGSDSNGEGMAAGADRRIAPDLVAGTAFGYARTTTVGSGTAAASNSYAGALYATWTPSAFVVDARLAGRPCEYPYDAHRQRIRCADAGRRRRSRHRSAGGGRTGLQHVTRRRRAQALCRAERRVAPPFRV